MDGIALSSRPLQRGGVVRREGATFSGVEARVGRCVDFVHGELAVVHIHEKRADTHTHTLSTAHITASWGSPVKAPVAVGTAVTVMLLNEVLKLTLLDEDEERGSEGWS